VSSALRVVAAAREHHAEFARFFAGLELDDPVPEVDRWVADMVSGTIFLADRGHFVGYAFREDFGDLVYVRHVVVAAEARGRGVGRAVMRELARLSRDRGATRWELNVKRENIPAIRLYEQCGMRAEYATRVVRIDWPNVVRLPGSARPLVARIVRPEDDLAIEQGLRLAPGKLARLRSLEGVELAQLVEHGRPVAFASFDARFPGCFPFRVAAPELARPMLEHLAPLRRLDVEWIQLVIEDDTATEAALVAAGARTTLEIVHMSGAIPSEI